MNPIRGMRKEAIQVTQKVAIKPLSPKEIFHHANMHNISVDHPQYLERIAQCRSDIILIQEKTKKTLYHLIDGNIYQTYSKQVGKDNFLSKYQIKTLRMTLGPTCTDFYQGENPTFLD